MRRRGMPATSILAALRDTNQTVCSPPLLDHEVERISESISRYDPAEERGRISLGLTSTTPGMRTALSPTIVEMHGSVLKTENGTSGMTRDGGLIDLVASFSSPWKQSGDSGGRLKGSTTTELEETVSTTPESRGTDHGWKQ